MNGRKKLYTPPSSEKAGGHRTPLLPPQVSERLARSAMRTGMSHSAPPAVVRVAVMRAAVMQAAVVRATVVHDQHRRRQPCLFRRAEQSRQSLHHVQKEANRRLYEKQGTSTIIFPLPCGRRRRPPVAADHKSRPHARLPAPRRSRLPWSPPDRPAARTEAWRRHLQRQRR